MGRMSSSSLQRPRDGGPASSSGAQAGLVPTSRTLGPFCFDPPRPAVVAFAVAYMVIFTGWALSSGNTEFLFYAGVMVVLIVGIGLMDRRVRFSWLVLWGLALWGFLHMAGGTVPIPDSIKDPEGLPKLYSARPLPWFIKYDQFVHAFGFGVATLAAWESLRTAVRCPARPSLGLCVLMVCAGMGLGAMNEVVEFIATRLMTTNVGGYENTGWDLVSNLTGCTLAAVWLYVRPASEESCEIKDVLRSV